MSLFDKLWDERPVRLLGIRASRLVTPDEPYQLSLFSEEFLGAKKKGASAPDESLFVDSDKKKKLDEAMRSIRDKFGKDSIQKGL